MADIDVNVLASLYISEMPHWVVWRFDYGKQKNPQKVPYIPGTTKRANSAEHTTWRSFDEAVEAYTAGGWEGIGFELGFSGLVGIDIDHCVTDTGEIEPWVRRLIQELDSYTEYSVSRKGIHILLKGTLPPRGRKKPPIEFYETDRYFAMTGWVIDGKSVINDRQSELLDFHHRTFPELNKSDETEEPALCKREIVDSDIANAATWLGKLSLARCEDYDSWLKVGMALSELGEVGLALWDRWSQKSGKYTPGVCRDKWRTITPSDGITLGSLKYWADEDAEQPTSAETGMAFKAANRTMSVFRDCLFVESRNGKRQVSTFMFYPKRLLEDVDTGGEDAILGDIVASGRRWPDMVMPKSAFSTASSLCKALPSIYWQWTGSDNDTKLFLMFISSMLEESGMPHATSTAVVGRHGNYWVTKDMTMDATTVYTRGDAPILYRSPEVMVRNKLSDTAPNLELTFQDDSEYAQLAKTIGDNLVCSNHPDSVALMIGWFFAAPLMSVFQDAGIRFPHLNIYGTKGSGKTTSVLRLFLPLMGLPKPSTWTPNTTMFVIRSLFSSTNGVPISFGEFRAATLQNTRSDFLRILLMAYDTGRDARGQADLSTKTYDLLAPVVIDGEDALSDPALRERTIFVNLHPEHIVDESIAFKAMDTLMHLPLSDFAAPYYRYTLTIDKNTIAPLFEQYLAKTKECPLHLPDRMRRNMAVVMCGMHFYNDFISRYDGAQLNISVESFTSMIKAQGILLSDGRSRSAVDDFVEDLVAYASSSSDYHYAFLLRYDSIRQVVWFHLPSAHAWWVRTLRSRGVSGLEFTALRAQLIERAMDSYAIAETIIQTATHGRLSCFGVSLPRCLEFGLNVSEHLDKTTVEIRGGV